MLTRVAQDSETEQAATKMKYAKKTRISPQKLTLGEVVHHVSLQSNRDSAIGLRTFRKRKNDSSSRNY